MSLPSVSLTARHLSGGEFIRNHYSSWLDGQAEKLIARYGNAKIVVPGHGKIGDASLLEKTKQRALEAIAAQ